MVAETTDTQFLCTLQPRPGSELAQGFAACRTACQSLGIDVDETNLYPPHITVTGFFSATAEQAAQVCELATALAKELHLIVAQSGCTAQTEQPVPAVELVRVLSTDTGYVIADAAAPDVARLAKALSEKAGAFGLHLRPKAVKHVSLASGRETEEQACISHVYSALPLGFGPWDLVISQLLVKADVQTMSIDGVGHQFKELLRLPLGVGTPPCTAAKAFHHNTKLVSVPLPLASITKPCAHVEQHHSGRTSGCRTHLLPFAASTVTPMKRRPRSLPPCEPCEDDLVTPPMKQTRAGSASRHRAAL